MARQAITIVINQASSGAGISITQTYTSDGVVVSSWRRYLADSGGFTIDLAMSAEVRWALRRLVEDLQQHGQLF